MAFDNENLNMLIPNSQQTGPNQNLVLSRNESSSSPDKRESSNSPTRKYSVPRLSS